MPLPERQLGVWVNRVFVGNLRQRGANVTFAVHPSYADDPNRPVLGLIFENDLSRVHSARLRLPTWFANLLPEGQLRRWLAQDAGVPMNNEVQLLATAGHDLPGAVTVLPLPPDALSEPDDDAPAPPPIAEPEPLADERGRFSLAGVQLKLSMVAAGDRLVVPLGGTLGDWIVKFPDATFPHLPVVEYVTMELARRVGVEVPRLRLMTREQLPDTPDALWRAREDVAYAIRRFDREPNRSLVHIEDFAQVRNVRPDRKYDGSYEQLAALVHRGHDAASVRELVRRLTFNLLVDNSDAHLKNWSLIYRDPRRPVLSPAYDLVSVAPYPGYNDQLALSIAGTRRATDVRLDDLVRLGSRLGVEPAGLRELAANTVEETVREWPAVAEQHLAGQKHGHGRARAAIGEAIQARASSVLA